MPLNSYFLQGSPTEQRLVQDLINEQLKIYGQDVVYLPRNVINKNSILREITASGFDDAFRMEAYLLNYQGFEGSGDILSKFGVQSTDAVTFIISKERYEDFISPMLSDRDEIVVSSRPQEGDLIYFPLDNTMFEIKYVEAKKPFYQLNNLYVYQLSCEVADLALDDEIDTGIEAVDQSVVDFVFTTTMTMVGIAATAASVTLQTANETSTLNTGSSVTIVDLINDGTGYTAPPIIRIGQAPTDGLTATAVAIMTSRTGQVGQSIDRIQITNPGFGYTTPPTIVIRSQNAIGSGAAATAVLAEGSLGAPNIVDGGQGYVPSDPPIITIERPDRVATATATVGASGTITALTLTDGGDGYITAPTVTISTPNRSGSISSFRLNNAGIKTGDVYSQDPDHSSLNSSGVGGFAGSHGANYEVGDIVTFVKDSGVGTAGTESLIRIDSVNQHGEVTGFTQIYGGYDYEVSESNSNGLYEAEYVSGSNNGSGLRLRVEVITGSVTGTTAVGVASISSAGIVTSLTLTNPGGGYTKPPHANAPTVTISNDSSFKDPTVFPATAVAIVNTDGELASIRYTNAGAGYTTAPTITVASPDVGEVDENYQFKEIVRGVSTGTTAIVSDWDSDTRVLEVTRLSEPGFTIGEFVVGIGTTLNGSNAKYRLNAISDQDEVDTFADNDTFESQADLILDFTESNPFGEY